MTVRYGVHADTEAECAQALQELCVRLGLTPVLPPRLLTDDRWMARAVPKAEAPTIPGRGLEG